jgi:hypothetical protein
VSGQFRILHNDEHPALYAILTGGVISLEEKQQGREADHSLLYSAEVKNGGAVSPLFLTSSWCNA